MGGAGVIAVVDLCSRPGPCHFKTIRRKARGGRARRRVRPDQVGSTGFRHARYDRARHVRECSSMVKHFDHCTIVVRDVDRAKMFFGLLGFKEAMSVVIAGEPFASYMGVPGIEADHVTLVLENASPRTEIQLLRYRRPEPLPDPHIRDLYKVGMNHICFAVENIEAEVAKLRANGFKTRNEIMDFHSRKLVFVDGPEGVTIELSQWH